MTEPGEVVAAAFPRPGPALRVVLGLVAAAALVGALVAHWMPGGETGAGLFLYAAFQPSRALVHPWTILTSGIVTNPASFAHALWSIVGLYFLATDLEKKWGSARLVRFLLASVILGNLVVLAVDRVLPMPRSPSLAELFHPGLVMGPTAAIAAIAIAWAKENAERQIRLFFFLPVKGKALYGFTFGFAVLMLLFNQPAPEGAMAPFGGILAGFLLGGSPSPVRALWRRLTGGRSRHPLKVESLVDDQAPTASRRAAGARSSRSGAPSLRILQGGVDDPKSSKNPKDKRYLN